MADGQTAAPASETGTAEQNTTLSSILYHNTGLEAVLGRLENVKQRGERWEARCPAHDDTKKQPQRFHWQ